MMEVTNIKEKFKLMSAFWTPRKVAELNGQQVILAKLKGDFIWHSHAQEDELFMVIKGRLFIDFRDKTEVIKEGELFVVPKGVEHRPRTDINEEVHVLLMEPLSTKHTGAIESDRTVNTYEWI